MNDETPLRAALQKLLAQGEAASDNRMLKAHAAKNAPPPVEEMCPECKEPLAEGKCLKCGYEAPAEGADESELAGLLEQGAAAEG